jgi:hypothetical protein
MARIRRADTIKIDGGQISGTAVNGAAGFS